MLDRVELLSVERRVDEKDALLSIGSPARLRFLPGGVVTSEAKLALVLAHLVKDAQKFIAVDYALKDCCSLNAILFRRR